MSAIPNNKSKENVLFPGDSQFLKMTDKLIEEFKNLEITSGDTECLIIKETLAYIFFCNPVNKDINSKYKKAISNSAFYYIKVATEDAKKICGLLLQLKYPSPQLEKHRKRLMDLADLVGKNDPDFTLKPIFLQLDVTTVYDILPGFLKKKMSSGDDYKGHVIIINDVKSEKPQSYEEILHKFKEEEEKKIQEKERETCVICLEKKRELLFTPCNHIAVCGKCPKMTECPICKTKIDKTIKFFFA